MSKILKFFFGIFCLALFIGVVAAMRDSSSNTPPAKVENWKYSKGVDSFTDKTSYYACTLSKNIVGGYGNLCFRKMNGILDGFFEVKGGIIHCHDNGCAMQMRFDDGPVQTKFARESSDPTENVVYFSNPLPIMKSARNSKRLRISIDLYRSGPLNFEFDPHGFDLDRMLKQ